MDRPDSPDVAGACGGPPGERANCQDYAEDHGLVLLRVLAERRRWLGYRDFETEFRRAARDMAESEGDADLAKLTVSPRQWARWYAGQVKTRPHPDACRVLEHMFGYPVRQLFAPAEAAEGAGPVVRGVRADSYAPSGGVIVAQRPADVTPGTLPLMQWLDELRSLSELRLGSARERERVYDHLVEILERWAGTMDRREFLRLLSWASSYAAATPLIDAGEARRMAGAIAAPSRADAAALKHVEGVLWHAARQDDLLGPQAALHTVLSQRDLLRWFLTGCHDPLRSEALSLLSQAARLAGWLSFDSGDFAGAWRYYDEARSAAHEARNSALAAQVLCNMSHLATWEGKPRVGIDHAVAAQRWAAQTGDEPLKAYAHQVAARAYAADGQAAAFAELEHAERRIDGASDTSRSVVHFNGVAQIASDRSACLLFLGGPKELAEAARRALELYDPSFVRNRAFATLDLGRAYIRAREAAEAAESVSAAVGLSMLNRSPRFVSELRRTLGDFARWPEVREVRELEARCAEAGVTPQ